MKQKSMLRFYRMKEDQLREQLANPVPAAAYQNQSMQKVAASSPAVVEILKRRYLNDRNAVRVWDAIMQLHFSAQVQARPLILPDWILAYLVTAAEGIMGRAVNIEEAPLEAGRYGRKVRKSKIPEPERNLDGSVTRYSDWYGGATAPERVEMANEALGFKTTQGGANPFLMAHRDIKDEEALSLTNALRREGLTMKAAAEQIDDPQFKKAGDRTRKLRRIIRRLSSGKT